jgi:hypothetical protein
MERVGVCLSCHKDIPTGNFVYRLVSKAGSVLGLIPKTDADHQKLIGRALFIAAGVEVFGAIIAVLVVVAGMFYLMRRKKSS